MARDVIQETAKAISKSVSDQTVEYIEGTASVIPNCDYSAKTIYNFNGLGGIFNGNYYIRKATHIISNEGYSVELDAVNTDHVVTVTQESTTEAPLPLSPPKDESTGYTMYQIVRGDCLSALGRKFGVPYMSIFEANRDKIKNPDLIYAGDWIKIPKK